MKGFRPASIEIDKYEPVMRSRRLPSHINITDGIVESCIGVYQSLSYNIVVSCEGRALVVCPRKIQMRERGDKSSASFHHRLLKK